MRRGPRRQTIWLDHNVDESQAANSDAVVNLTEHLVGKAKGMTLVRTLINLSFNNATAGTGSTCDQGIVMVENDALAALALPEPADPTEDPGWVWRNRLIVSSSLANDSSQFVIVKEDIRSRRKFPGDDNELVLILRVGGLGGGPINTTGWVRTLWMLP